jgi:hypothetical protein
MFTNVSQRVPKSNFMFEYKIVSHNNINHDSQTTIVVANTIFGRIQDYEETLNVLCKNYTVVIYEINLNNECEDSNEIKVKEISDTIIDVLITNNILNIHILSFCYGSFIGLELIKSNLISVESWLCFGNILAPSDLLIIELDIVCKSVNMYDQLEKKQILSRIYPTFFSDNYIKANKVEYKLNGIMYTDTWSDADKFRLIIKMFMGQKEYIESMLNNMSITKEIFADISVLNVVGREDKYICMDKFFHISKRLNLPYRLEDGLGHFIYVENESLVSNIIFDWYKRIDNK